MYGVSNWREEGKVVLDLSNNLWKRYPTIMDHLNVSSRATCLSKAIVVGSTSSSEEIIPQFSPSGISYRNELSINNEFDGVKNVLSLYGFRKLIRVELMNSRQKVMVHIDNIGDGHQVDIYDDKSNKLYSEKSYINLGTIISKKDVGPELTKIFEWLSLTEEELQDTNLIVLQGEILMLYSNVVEKYKITDTFLINNLQRQREELINTEIAKGAPRRYYKAKAQHFRNHMDMFLEPVLDILELYYKENLFRSKQTICRSSIFS